MIDVAARLAEVRARIDAAARDAQRDPATVTLVVVTKEVALDSVRAAIDAGATELGENRAQELVAKSAALAPEGDALRWHFIGRLQRNKVRALAPHVALWQSLDRAELIDAVSAVAPSADVLIQVNVAGEAQKGGCPPAEAPALVDRAREHGLVVRGLMTVPPLVGDPRPHFALLRALTDACGLAECSMGMSGDFEAAIGEGATIVRVGTAVFGPRPER
jgi:pyridoxal phosphate enzyme (YggS family)